MERFYEINNEELIETRKENGKVLAFIHNGIYTLDGAFHIIQRDDFPAIFDDESLFMASLHKEHPAHTVFNGNVMN